MLEIKVSQDVICKKLGSTSTNLGTSKGTHTIVLRTPDFCDRTKAKQLSSSDQEQNCDQSV